jgi:hypothetical protein
MKSSVLPGVMAPSAMTFPKKSIAEFNLLIILLPILPVFGLRVKNTPEQSFAERN